MPDGGVSVRFDQEDRRGSIDRRGGHRWRCGGCLGDDSDESETGGDGEDDIEDDTGLQ